MSDTCCCCCEIGCGVSCIFSIDIICFLIYLVIACFFGYYRGHVKEFSDMIKENLAFFDFTGYFEDEYKKYEEMVFASYDTILAFGIIGVLVIFLPRIVVFIVMRCKEEQINVRRFSYLIRVFSLIGQLLLQIICCIILGYYIKATLNFLYFVNMPAILIILSLFCCALTCDSYYACVAKNFLEKARRGFSALGQTAN
jgi:hypothetical protein